MSIGVINGSKFVHDYRGAIAHVIDELKVQIKKTEGAIEKVAETWKDDNFREFESNFNEDKQQITPLCDVLDVYQSETLYQLELKLRELEEHDFTLGTL